MNKKHIAVFFILFLFLAASAAEAKSKTKSAPPQAPATIDDIVAKMKKQLELTDEQTAAVKPIVENYLAQEEQLRLDEKKQLKKVLTDQQLYTWNFLLNEAKMPKGKKKQTLF